MSVDRVAVLLDDARFAAPVEVGWLSKQAGGAGELVRFSYSASWLDETAEAFAIDPELPLFPGDFFPASGRAMFGIFRDTSPDRWGRMLMERREALDARAQKRKPQRFGEWAFLLGVSDATRIGALRLQSVDGERGFLDDHSLGAPPATRLRELEAIALALDDPETQERAEYDAWLRQLLAPGSSLGGARPKATFAAKDETLWIAKFPGREDRRDVGAWEFLAHTLAERAQIDVPHAEQLRLGGSHHTFAVQRFDRIGKRRRLYASAMTLLARSDGDVGSYLDIAQALQDYGDPATLRGDLEQLYRRVIFNALIGNRDDHLRNHGFLRGAEGWSLAPAFDMNPNPDKDEHALTLDESSGAPNIATIRATRELYRLTRAAAVRVEAQVRAALDGWRELAQSLGISRRELQQLAVVIDEHLS